MSNALVKRLCNALEAQRNGELVHRVELPRPVLPRLALPAASVVNARAVSGIEDHPPVIELVRDCAVYDGEKWLARYIFRGLRGRVYEFNASIELTRQQQARYAPENVIVLPSDFETDIEQCACCGAWTPPNSAGSVRCPIVTPHYVCYGRTTRSGYFYCRPSCGWHSQLQDGRQPTHGLKPGRRGGGNFETQL